MNPDGGGDDTLLPFPPPPGPPPLLAFDQVAHLAYHGWVPIHLPEHLTQTLHALAAAAATFFDRPHAEKSSLYPSSRGTELGFYHIPGEKEYLTLRHRGHADAELERSVDGVWEAAGRLLYRILHDLSRAGNFPPGVWDSLVAGSLRLPADATSLNTVPTLMRLFRYFPHGGFAAEHVDLGLLTLCIGNGKGLQVLDRSRTPAEYVDADGGATVVVGDTLRALLGDRVRAGKHRVVGNPSGRTSIVFALRPCLESPIDLSDFGGQGVVDSRAFYDKVKGSKYNINATKDVRERQQRAQKEREGEQSAGHAVCHAPDT